MNINFNDANFITSAYDVRNAPTERRPEIVMVGRSNVGKSSMINKLLNRKSIAKVSEKPGKTAAANYYDVGKKSILLTCRVTALRSVPRLKDAAGEA